MIRCIDSFSRKAWSSTLTRVTAHPLWQFGAIPPLDRSQASPYHRHLLLPSRCPRELGGVKQDDAADCSVRIHDQKIETLRCNYKPNGTCQSLADELRAFPTTEQLQVLIHCIDPFASQSTARPLGESSMETFGSRTPSSLVRYHRTERLSHSGLLTQPESPSLLGPLFDLRLTGCLRCVARELKYLFGNLVVDQLTWLPTVHDIDRVHARFVYSTCPFNVHSRYTLLALGYNKDWEPVLDGKRLPKTLCHRWGCCTQRLSQSSLGIDHPSVRAMTFDAPSSGNMASNETPQSGARASLDAWRASSLICHVPHCRLLYSTNQLQRAHAATDTISLRKFRLHLLENVRGAR